jgi:hypothetical protein
MKLKKPFFLLVILCMTLNNCSGLKEASNVLKNEKSSSTDEFLIQKKEALTKPPDFDIIPKPNSIENKSIVDKKKKNIKELLKTSQTESEGSSSKSSSTEDSILSQIKK